MKTILTLALLSVLVSCGVSDGPSNNAKLAAPTGTISKTWRPANGSTAPFRADYVDLRDPTQIKVTMAGYIKSNSHVGTASGGTFVQTVCVLSSSGTPAMTTDTEGYYDTALVSGSTTWCKPLVPQMKFRHGRHPQYSTDILSVYGRTLK